MNLNKRIVPQMAMPQMQPIIQNVTPFNDVQLVALIAAQRQAMDPKDAVKWANEILLQALKQSGDMQEAIKAWQKERKEAVEKEVAETRQIET